MGVITREALDQVWEENGLKFNVGRFHRYLLERGLLPYVTQARFSRKFYNIMSDFLVRGIKEHTDGRQDIAYSEGDDADAESEA